MARLSSVKIRRFLDFSVNSSSTADQGKALEDLICYVFAKIPGVSIAKRNALNIFQSEELDVALWNDRYPKGLPFLPNLILVECKNWSTPVDSASVSWFDSKLRTRGLTFRILFAANGITGNATERTSAHQIITHALREQRQLIVITKRELEFLTDTLKLVHLIKEKLCELAVAGTVLP